MTRLSRISVSQKQLAGFCRQYGITKLSFFGSILRDDFSPQSDVDVLIEFEPSVRVGLFGLAEIERELSNLLGRKVDLNTPGFFSGACRDTILDEAVTQYVKTP